jgi:cold shock CspA family protein
MRRIVMITGRILCFGAKGFGFLETDDSHLNVFVHINDIKDCRFLHEGDRVRLKVVPSSKYPGKFDAKDVEFIEPAPSSAVGS